MCSPNPFHSRCRVDKGRLVRCAPFLLKESLVCGHVQPCGDFRLCLRAGCEEGRQTLLISSRSDPRCRGKSRRSLHLQKAFTVPWKIVSAFFPHESFRRSWELRFPWG